MKTIYVKYELETEFVGTYSKEYCRYIFPDDWTQEEIDNYIYEDYSDMQMKHYESYLDYYDYCREYEYTENDPAGVDDYDYWEEYQIYVEEQGSYEILDHEPTEDEMSDSAYSMQEIIVRGSL